MYSSYELWMYSTYVVNHNVIICLNLPIIQFLCNFNFFKLQVNKFY